MSEPKQAIIIRADLGMTKGKMCAQAAHASVNALLSTPHAVDYVMAAWCDGIYKKVCLRVRSEDELVGIYEAAKSAGIRCSLITDLGLTQLGGPTKTAVGVGPASADEIDALVGGLKLL